jgi:hypothetical protein
VTRVDEILDLAVRQPIFLCALNDGREKEAAGVCVIGIPADRPTIVGAILRGLLEMSFMVPTLADELAYPLASADTQTRLAATQVD